MSMHTQPLTDLERSGLEAHKLSIGTPSQLSDCFRNGIAWANKSNSQLLSDIDTLLVKLNEVGCGGHFDLANNCAALSMKINKLT